MACTNVSVDNGKDGGMYIYSSWLWKMDREILEISYNINAIQHDIVQIMVDCYNIVQNNIIGKLGFTRIIFYNFISQQLYISSFIRNLLIVK